MADLRMPDLNKVLLAGRLTRDPELRYLPSGTPLCKMGLAVSRTYKAADGERKEETLFIDVTTWKGTAEYCGENLRKGRPIIVEGRLKTDAWEDKSTGEKRSKIVMDVFRVQTLDWVERTTTAAAPEPRPIEEPVPEDDIPF